MRKLFLLLSITFTLGYSQQKNEVKLNAVYTLLSVPEISYERLLSQESAIGASVAFSFNQDTDLNLALTPYYRLFFGKNYASGFFLEGNSLLISVNSTKSQYLVGPNGGYYVSQKEAQTAFGVGISAGGKFLTKSNFVGEIYGGLGRVFGDDKFFGGAYPRFGISIGKRF